VTRRRVEENFALFDFELGPEDMDALTGLNRDERIGPDPDQFNWVPKS
jgi:2,5-diketo-D-gluconate reductase A